MGFYLSLLTALVSYSENLAEKFIIGALTGVVSLLLLGVISRISKRRGKVENKESETNYEDEQPQKNEDSEKTIEASKPVFSFEKEKEIPSIQKQVKKEPVISNLNKPQRVSSNMNIDQLNKEYILSLLREKCHPRLFMQPYDAEKVGIANELYSSLKEDCTLSDLSTILSKAIDKLKIDLDTSQIVSKLLETCSPLNFMEPYNSEKIAKANELYAKILENKSNIIELINLKEDAIGKGVLIFPEVVEKVSPNIARIEDQNSDGQQEEPKIIVNYWKSSTGIKVRIVQYYSSELFVFEEENGNTWKTSERLKKTSGRIENGGVGAWFINFDSPNVKYHIKVFGGALVETSNGVISGIWECEASTSYS